MGVIPGVVVTGIGQLSPLGLDTETFWDAALRGTVHTNQLERFDTTALSAHRGGEIHGFHAPADAALKRPASCLAVELAVAAATMAVEDACLDRAGMEPERGGVCFGTVMATRPAIESWLNNSARVLERAWISPSLLSRAPAAELGFAGPNCVISTACAAGNSAIAYSAEQLRAGRADVMVAGGADELSYAMLLMFDSFRALTPDTVKPFDLHRRGLLLAEGAAALVLEREQDARARRAHVYGRVLGYANYADAHHMTAPHPEGRGAQRAMLSALARSGVGTGDVDYISAHGTGTPSNDVSEAHAVRSVFGPHTDNIPVSSLKAALGHAQGAASAIEAVGCLLALRDSLVPPTANYETRDPACDLDVVAGKPRAGRIAVALNNAFGFGGNIECVVFGAP